ncbi:MAG: hypothetical protein IPG98_16270 [Burkholderiales bacterium]|nr:hypothetical protein [Burkholderiales bacterium]MBK8666854.1 hypothetical protein [Burkholderiales bacterium]
MRTLTLTQNADWRAGLRAAGEVAAKGRYAGETLNFETPAQLFSHMTEKRWQLIRLAQGKGELAVRELARMAERDVRRVHDDVTALAELGIFERTDSGGVVCPYGRVYVDFMLEAA